jgi:hypothetical protein
MRFHRVVIFSCVFFLLFGAAAVIQNVLAETSSKTHVDDDLLVNSPALFTTPGKINTLLPLSEGRVLMGVSFISVGGWSAPHSLAVIQSGGSLDTDFQADPRLRVYEVYAAALQPERMNMSIKSICCKMARSRHQSWFRKARFSGSLDTAISWRKHVLPQRSRRLPRLS